MSRVCLHVHVIYYYTIAVKHLHPTTLHVLTSEVLSALVRKCKIVRCKYFSIICTL